MEFSSLLPFFVAMEGMETLGFSSYCPLFLLKNLVVTKFGRGFAQARGVHDSVVNAMGERGKGITTTNIEGLEKKNQALLKSMPKRPIAQFVEVMACDGGCINGPCSLAPLTIAKQIGRAHV